MQFNYKDVNKSKLLNILRYHGVGYLLKRIWLRLVLKPLIAAKKERTFQVRGTTYAYFHHSYNTTMLNERAVEIPYFRHIMAGYQKDHKRILEIGNVLSHYENPSWDIVDKFEKGLNIINIDIMNFRPSEPYDLIVAISTFEHVGFDEEPQDADKVLHALDYINERLLRRGGELVFSIPAGYNTHFESHISEGRIPADEMILMKRYDWKNNWIETRRMEDVLGLPYAMFSRGLIIVRRQKAE
jgi:hypothetical protein